MRMGHLAIKSAEGSSTVIFTAFSSNPCDEAEFQCELCADGFSGRVSGSCMYRNSLSDYFASLAAEWSGWPDEKSWMNDGVEVRLDATTDKLGHVALKVTLRTYNETCLSAVILIEAGMLDQIAADMKDIIG